MPTGYYQLVRLSAELSTTVPQDIFLFALYHLYQSVFENKFLIYLILIYSVWYSC